MIATIQFGKFIFSMFIAAYIVVAIGATFWAWAEDVDDSGVAVITMVLEVILIALVIYCDMWGVK